METGATPDLRFIQKRELHAAFFRLGKTVEQGRRVGWGGRNFFFRFRRRIKRGTKSALDELGAMDFHRRQRAEFAADFSTLAESSGIENPKGELQELLQSRSPNAPEYQTVSATGPDHDRVFECVVQYEGVELARGRGKSKKAAESDAALAALKKLRTGI